MGECMSDLSERQKLILTLVIRDYIETAQPVSSIHLVEDLGVTRSSATVRNEMVALTEMGYLRQPHNFSGRVPTEEGYRYFVRQLMEKIPYYSLRFTVKPGLTGWAQVKYGYGASVEDAIKKLQYELYYIKNMSVFLDIRIILRTIRIVLFGMGR